MFKSLLAAVFSWPFGFRFRRVLVPTTLELLLQVPSHEYWTGERGDEEVYLRLRLIRLSDVVTLDTATTRPITGDW